MKYTFWVNDEEWEIQATTEPWNVRLSAVALFARYHKKENWKTVDQLVETKSGFATIKFKRIK
jgi:hypothetical protein|tara:strand:- start:352 stop:540 length:189 start_codon:yes stop_codon:yes gene_type:complete